MKIVVFLHLRYIFIISCSSSDPYHIIGAVMLRCGVTYEIKQPLVLDKATSIKTTSECLPAIIKATSDFYKNSRSTTGPLEGHEGAMITNKESSQSGTASHGVDVIELHNLELDPNVGSPNGPDSHQLGGGSAGQAIFGVYLEGGLQRQGNVTITNVNIHDMGFNAIQVNRVSNFTLAQSTITNISGPDVYFRGCKAATWKNDPCVCQSDWPPTMCPNPPQMRERIVYCNGVYLTDIGSSQVNNVRFEEIWFGASITFSAKQATPVQDLKVVDCKFSKVVTGIYSSSTGISNVVNSSFYDVTMGTIGLGVVSELMIEL